MSNAASLASLTTYQPVLFLFLPALLAPAFDIPSLLLPSAAHQFSNSAPTTLNTQSPCSRHTSPYRPSHRLASKVFQPVDHRTRCIACDHSARVPLTSRRYWIFCYQQPVGTRPGAKRPEPPIATRSAAPPRPGPVDKRPDDKPCPTRKRGGGWAVTRAVVRARSSLGAIGATSHPLVVTSSLPHLPAPSIHCTPPRDPQSQLGSAIPQVSLLRDPQLSVTNSGTPPARHSPR